MTPKTYEIIVEGEAHPTIGDVFEDFEVRTESGRTILQAELLDQAALYGALDRLLALDLLLTEVRILDPGAP
jgi:hypothetical protein